MKPGPSILRRQMERLTLGILCAPGVVWVSWHVLKPLARILPLRFLHLFVGKVVTEQRVSLAGTVNLLLPGGQRLRMIAAADPVAILSDWGGWKGYEEDLMLVFPTLAAGARTFVDAGANTGLYILAASAVNPGITSLAVEPQGKVFERLEQNVRLNDLSSVRCLQIALSDHEGEVTLFEGDGALPIGSSIADADAIAWSQKQSVVPASTLDALAASQDLTSVDLVVMDIEGAEPAALRGAASVLDTHRPIIVCEVLTDEAGKELSHVLETSKYRYFHLTYLGPREAVEITGEVVLRNWLFLPSEKTAAVLDALASAGIQAKQLQAG